MDGSDERTGWMEGMKEIDEWMGGSGGKDSFLVS